MGGNKTTGGRRCGLAIPGLAVAALTIAQGGPGITALGPVRRRLFRGLAGYGDPGHVALTFDDGPDARSTAGFLDLLARRDIRATFFMLGSMVAAAPGLAAEVAAAGHEIAVHGWDHRYLTLRGPQDTFRDMARAREVIAETTGQVPVYVRPPYGVLSGGALLAAGRLGLRPLLWTCWGREWAPGATSGSVVRTLRRDLGGGATVLLHDSDATSPSGSARAALGALPWLLDECARRGLKAGPAAGHGLGRAGAIRAEAGAWQGNAGLGGNRDSDPAPPGPREGAGPTGQAKRDRAVPHAGEDSADDAAAQDHRQNEHDRGHGHPGQ
jgi:peptidoglycan/xylan/chitin deacetylase (PgdA/CDA1 family)